MTNTVQRSITTKVSKETCRHYMFGTSLGTGREKWYHKPHHLDENEEALAISVLKKLGEFVRKLTWKKGPPAITPVVHPQRETVQRGDTHRPSGRPAQRRTHDKSRPQRPRPERPARPQRPPRAKQEPAPHRAETPWDPASFVVEPEPGKLRFHDLNLPDEIMHAIHDLGFHYCTPIQAGILEHTLAGKDATGRAQTGTGKTAAFLITILTHLLRNPVKQKRNSAPRALILAPTRELVLQIEKDAKALSPYTRIKTVAVFGGMDYGKQLGMLKGTVDIVAATPGRLLDFKGNRNIDLSQVEILVIDEADRMLDMGFIPDVRKIINATPMKGTRQTLFFSATLTPEVNRLAALWTRDPVFVDVTPPDALTLASIEQILYITTDEEKFVILHNLITARNLERVMVFANRRDETQFLKDLLSARGVSCGLLSGDVSQVQRGKTLEGFRQGRFKVLVATDVAARGLHIEGVSHVVNFSLPLDPEDYVHRIGRTGRAGATGISISFATEMEAYQIPVIEQFIGRKLVGVYPEDDLLKPLPPLAEGVAEPVKRRSPAPRQGRQGRRPFTGRRDSGRGPSRGGPRRGSTPGPAKQ